MNFRPQNAIQKKIRTDIVRPRLDNGAEVEHWTHAAAARRRTGLHGVIRLRRTIGKHRVATFVPSFLQKVLKLSDLVAAKQRGSREILTLDPEIDSEFFGNPFEFMKWRRIKTQRELSQAGKLLASRSELY